MVRVCSVRFVKMSAAAGTLDEELRKVQETSNQPYGLESLLISGTPRMIRQWPTVSDLINAPL